MAQKNVAVVNEAGEVVNVIVVDDAGPEFDPGPGRTIVKDDKIGLGWKRDGAGKFKAPTPPVPELPPQAAARTEQVALAEKFRAGAASVAEKDRLLALMLGTP